jgi:four helix bundle protein
MAIASKEAREVWYWLRLLKDSGISNNQECVRLIGIAEELVRILSSIVKTGMNEKTVLNVKY